MNPKAMVTNSLKFNDALLKECKMKVNSIAKYLPSFVYLHRYWSHWWRQSQAWKWGGLRQEGHPA
jgi:hypothetical protein